MQSFFPGVHIKIFLKELNFDLVTESNIYKEKLKTHLAYLIDQVKYYDRELICNLI